MLPLLPLLPLACFSSQYPWVLVLNLLPVNFLNLGLL